MAGDLVDEITNYGYDDFVYMTHLLTYHTVRFIEETASRLGEDHAVLKGLLSEVKASETVADVKNWLTETCTLIYELFQRKQSGKTQELAVKLKEHIDRGYKDPALCADSLSVLSGLSSSYIRFIFKKTHGISVAGYINSIRLEFCKNQLLTTKNAITTIYKSAGYANYNYFFTLFKKQTGMTPVQFRINKIR
jgi:two-component system response regulator YesN